MSYRIEIPYLQIGKFIVETPVGLEELITKAWSTSKEKRDFKFIEKYERQVYKNEKGQIVTKYTLKEGK